MRNKTMETAVKLVEAMEAGEDPYRFLKDQGYASPEKAYQNIKQRCREKDPELAERFPKRYVRKEPVPEEETVELVYDPSIAEEYRREQAAKAEEADAPPASAKLVNIINGYEAQDYTVTAIVLPDLGEFYYDRKYRSVDWRSELGEEISLPPEDWRKLEKEIPRVLKILGVEI